MDTNIWILHFQAKSKRLIQWLESAEVLTHSLILGEIACGKLKKRREILEHLQALPKAENLREDELFDFITDLNLFGKSIGIVDVHLLASCRLSACDLWTNDQKLKREARRLDIKAI